MPQQETCQILDGKAVSAYIRDQVKAKIDDFVGRGFRKPGLAVVLIGDNPASKVYVKNKVAACKKVGMESYLHEFPKDVSLSTVLDCLRALNSDQTVDGILVQLPLPDHLPTDQVLDAVAADKDVDGLHDHNLGLLLAGKPGLRPCTPQGVMALLEYYKIPLAGKKAVVIGRSNLVGKPIALMLLEKHATVTMCHSRTKDIDAVVATADIVVAALGKETFVKGSWIKPGAVVIDVGINRRELPDGGSELVGDVDFQEASKNASYITPVPGGVGPMTIALLLSNTLQAYQTNVIPNQLGNAQ
jgi:methylenetetrahydrofolate dehydrogenase (NADP+)/methenyltetrahydrofolate cyclohydrolase